MKNKSITPGFLLLAFLLYLAASTCAGVQGTDDGSGAASGSRETSVSATSVTLSERIAAAQAAAATSSSCQAISIGTDGDNGFYWEIGDENGIVVDPQSGLSASGSVNPPGDGSTNYTRTTSMPIASASKWIYGSYVAETQAVFQNGAWRIPDADVPFLNFTSGYDNMNDACSATATGLSDPTVGDCLNQPGTLKGTTNGTRITSDGGHFFYNSGHMEVFQGGGDASIANVMNGANDDDATLASKVAAAFGARAVQVNLTYFTPILAGGVVTTPADYAAFLQGMVRSDNPLIMSFLLNPAALDPAAVCTNPFDPACPTAIYSPAEGVESWHYAIAHWIEDDPYNGDGSYSSPGAYGFYPWVDATKQYYGIVARANLINVATSIRASTYYKSVACGQIIRSAFFGDEIFSNGFEL
ncbi:MAG: hypothetical protein P4L92_10900 [Rudaea sp.]|nr:hypothetical protein [Rudaea sp.]